MDSAPQISPTDLSQFMRLKSCDRYLWFRLRERNPSDEEMVTGVNSTPQQIAPLLRDAGKAFESRIESQIAGRYRTIRAITDSEQSGGNSYSSEDGSAKSIIVQSIRDLELGETVVLFQTPLAATVWGWHLTGLADIVRLERNVDGTGVKVLITDIKHSGSPSLSHWLQVGLYAAMITSRFVESHSVDGVAVSIGILHRDQDTNCDAKQLLGIQEGEGTLQVASDIEPYIWLARELLDDQDAPARRVLSLPVIDTFFSLGTHCDNCTYQEQCLSLCHENEDLSLLRLRPAEKKSLWNAGVRTISALAELPVDVGHRESDDDISSTKRLANLKRLFTVSPRIRGRIHELKMRAETMLTAHQRQIENRAA